MKKNKNDNYKLEGIIDNIWFIALHSLLHRNVHVHMYLQAHISIPAPWLCMGVVWSPSQCAVLSEGAEQTGGGRTRGWIAQASSPCKDFAFSCTRWKAITGLQGKK